ncbi:MAG: FAD-dependent oxidoreductase [Planctomycetota bacterium]|nr:FAD-dependent oxidoreductase [Planctomycetota bacterium]
MAEKVIIIGSGPAGWTSAIYTARAALEPLVFEGAITYENQMAGTLPLGQLALTTEVENYPGFPAGNMESYLDASIDETQRKMMAPHAKEGVSGPELVELMRQQAKNMGTRIITRDIVSVDFSGNPSDGKPFVLTDSDGQTHETLSVIVATGARANYLGMESEETYRNKGVSACAVCDGALPRFRNNSLAVIGGGDSAVEEADYLSKFAGKVYLVHRRDELRASKVMAKRAMDNPKIEILWNRIPDEILGNETDGVTAIRLKSTAGEDDIEPEVSGVFLAIGHTPNTAFLADSLALTEKKYINWAKPGRTTTSVEGVFAAGDVADDYYRQAVTAAGSGCMAALDCERWLADKGL